MKILERLPRETGRDYALRTIKDNIINLELAPGSQISENELAAELQLSRTPVREALIELARVKIIEIQPQKRSVISLIDYELVEESRFMRKLLECAVAGLACELAGPEDLIRLQENVQLQNFYYDNFSPERLWALDDEFHQLLFDITHKSQTFSLMRNISIHFDRVRSMALFSLKDLKIVRDHVDITEAIANRDAPKAQALMEVHLSRYKIDAAGIRKKYPQYFKEAI